MGNLLRRYWTAALLSRDAAGERGAPWRAAPGEDLVAFRGSDGKVAFGRALLPPRARCSSARTGVRLPLLVPRLNTTVDATASTCRTSRPGKTSRRGQHTAYPCIEKGGAVFAYMGRPTKSRSCGARMAHRAGKPFYVSKGCSSATGRRAWTATSTARICVPARQDRRARPGAGICRARIRSMDQGRRPPDLHMKKTAARILWRRSPPGSGADSTSTGINQWFMRATPPSRCRARHPAGHAVPVRPTGRADLHLVVASQGLPDVEERDMLSNAKVSVHRAAHSRHLPALLQQANATPGRMRAGEAAVGCGSRISRRKTWASPSRWARCTTAPRRRWARRRGDRRLRKRLMDARARSPRARPRPARSQGLRAAPVLGALPRG